MVASWLRNGETVDQQERAVSSPEDFFSAVSSYAAGDRCTWLFAHCLAYQLTLLGYWDYVSRGGERFLWAVLEDPPTIVCTIKGRRLRKWVDINNYFRSPLWDLVSQNFNAPLVVGEAPALKTSAPDATGRICTSLSTLILSAIKIVKSRQLCSWQPTASSLAWTAYRRCYLCQPIYVHGHKDATALERRSLFGGRLECSRLGLIRSPVVALDVNSLYPYVMASTPSPCKLTSWQPEATVRELHQALSGHHCLAEVRVMAPPHPLPVRGVGSVDYSTADTWYCLSDPELSAVVRDGMVSAVGQLARYEVADLFSRWVGDLYAYKLRSRESGNLAEVQLWKMMLNGLAGKFAQKMRSWSVNTQIPAPGRWAYFWVSGPGSGRLKRCRSLDGVVSVEEELGEKRDSFPAITSAVTAGGRLVLAGLVKTAGGTETHYLDTDSIHVSEAGRLALDLAGNCHDSRLGALKTVASAKDAYYWGPKQYRVGDKWVSNILRLSDRVSETGYLLQEMRHGLEFTFAAPRLDTVYVSDRLVRCQQAIDWGESLSQSL